MSTVTASDYRDSKISRYSRDDIYSSDDDIRIHAAACEVYKTVKQSLTLKQDDFVKDLLFAGEQDFAVEAMLPVIRENRIEIDEDIRKVVLEISDIEL